jgi:hypothetical protein
VQAIAILKAIFAYDAIPALRETKHAPQFDAVIIAFQSTPHRDLE